MFDNKMKASGIVSILLYLCASQVCGQACPQSINAANMCVPGVYTGERVFIDTTTYNTLVNNCTCSYTTTSSVLKMVTYVAPNYPECNSAIRLQTASGNNMRFECLISGTYVDTAMHKSGQATFEKYADYYDNNYCLMLEVAGQPTDSVTVTCTVDIPMEFYETSTASSNINTASRDVTGTKSETFVMNDVIETESTSIIPKLTTLSNVIQSDASVNNIDELILNSTEAPVINTTVGDVFTSAKDIVANEIVDTINTEFPQQTAKHVLEANNKTDIVMVVDSNNVTMSANESAVNTMTETSSEEHIFEQQNTVISIPVSATNIEPIETSADKINGLNGTTVLTSEQKTSVTTVSNMKAATLKDQIIEGQTTVVPKIEVSTIVAEQSTSHTLVFGTTQDVHMNTNANESIGMKNVSKANTSSIIQEDMSLTFSLQTDNNESASNTAAAINDTIVFDSSMSAINENIGSENFTESTTDLPSNNTSFSEADGVTAGTPTNATNIVTAIVTGTVLFNAGGENSSKIIQTIDKVSNLYADALNNTDFQTTQTTSKDNITFRSNNAAVSSPSNVIELSSPSSIFSEKMYIAPVTPPIDLSNSLIMIPEQADVIQNVTFNETDTFDPAGNYAINFSSVDSFVEPDAGNISFINSVPFVSSPYTASEPRVVTENSEPIRPIENITDTTTVNFQANSLSTGETFDPSNVSMINSNSEVKSSIDPTEAPIMPDVNTDTVLDTFWDTQSGSANLQSSMFTTGTTPLYKAGSMPVENSKLSTRTTISTQTTPNLQEPMLSDTASSFDLHNTFQDAGMIRSTASTISEVTHGGYSETTSANTQTENNLQANEGFNEPFVNNSFSESSNSVDIVPNISDTTADSISFGETPKRIHISEYTNNNLSKSSIEHTTNSSDLLGNKTETLSYTNATVDQLSFGEPPKRIHISEYISSNLADSNTEQTTASIGMQGSQNETVVDAGAVTADTISFGEPPKRIHISEYINSNLSDSNTENTIDSGVQGSKNEPVTEFGEATVDKISFGEPPKRIHISEYMNSNMSDTSIDHTTNNGHLQGEKVTSTTAQDVGNTEVITEFITTTTTNSQSVDQAFDLSAENILNHASESGDLSILERSNFADKMLPSTAIQNVDDIVTTTESKVLQSDPTSAMEVNTQAQLDLNTLSQTSVTGAVVATSATTVSPDNNIGVTTVPSSSAAPNLDVAASSNADTSVSTDVSDNVITLSKFSVETSTSSVDSIVQSTANIISEEIVPVQNIPNEAVVPPAITNVVNNKDTSIAANILSAINDLTLQERSSVGHNTAPIEPIVPVVTENKLDQDLLQSSEKILSEIEKHILMDVVSTTEKADSSLPSEATSNFATGTSSSKPTAPIGNMLESVPEQSIDVSAEKSPATSTPVNTVTESAYKNVPTTQGQSFNMVEETMVVTEGPKNVETGKSKSGDKEMNVSLDKKSRGLPIDVNNNTYIIVVGTIAGLVVLATVIGIMCHNKRKRRSEKVDISGNGIDPASHQNQAFDNEVNDPEQGTSVTGNISENSPSNDDLSNLPPKAQEY